MTWKTQPLGRAFDVRPLDGGGFKVTHIPSGLWMHTTRTMTLGDAAEILILTAEKQKVKIGDSLGGRHVAAPDGTARPHEDEPHDR